MNILDLLFAGWTPSAVAVIFVTLSTVSISSVSTAPRSRRRSAGIRPITLGCCGWLVTSINSPLLSLSSAFIVSWLVVQISSFTLVTTFIRKWLPWTQVLLDESQSLTSGSWLLFFPFFPVCDGLFFLPFLSFLFSSSGSFPVFLFSVVCSFPSSSAFSSLGLGCCVTDTGGSFDVPLTFVRLFGLAAGVVVSGGGSEDQEVVCLELLVLKLGHAEVPILEFGRYLLDVTSVFLDFLINGKEDEKLIFQMEIKHSPNLTPWWLCWWWKWKWWCLLWSGWDSQGRALLWILCDTTQCPVQRGLQQ